MMKFMLSIIITFLSLIVVQAQGNHLNVYSNYVFDDKFETYNSNSSFYEGKIKGGYQWGVGLEHQFTPSYGIELMYFRQDTDVPVSYYTDLIVDRVLEVSVNYIMLGGAHYIGNEKVKGYWGLMAGAVIYDNKEPILDEPDNSSKFAWGVRLGANIWATEKVGLKIQAHMLSGVQLIDGGFYLGSGGGGTSFSWHTTLYQFSLGGGLVFRLGE
jgi:hypothetical protein